jgi:RNA polymerase sigma-70 factor (ECF subfamily)
MRTRQEKQVSRLPARTERYAVGKTDPVQGFQALYQDYLGSIYRYAYSRIRNQEEAEDIASHVFLKALRGVDYERGPKTIHNWLFRVARTTIADYWRARQGVFTYSLEELLADEREGADEEEPIAMNSKRAELLRCLFSRLSTPSLEELFEANWMAGDGEEPTTIHNSSADLVQHLLQRLPWQYREVLVCRFLLSLSIKETALRMGLTEANVKVLQLRALKRAAGLEPVITDQGRNGMTPGKPGTI